MKSMNQKFIEVINKIQQLKKDLPADLSAGEDLAVAIMNLVSLEEHFFFTGAKMKKSNYFDLLTKVRQIRKELLAQIVKEPEGEIWCISKHLLAASMRLIEVGTKYQDQNKKAEAENLFVKAFDLYNLFWGLNLDQIDIGEVKKINDNSLNKASNKNDIQDKLNNLITQLVDCCKE